MRCVDVCLFIPLCEAGSLFDWLDAGSLLLIYYVVANPVHAILLGEKK